MRGRARVDRHGDEAWIVLRGQAEAPVGAGFDAELRHALQQALSGALEPPRPRLLVLCADAGGWPVALDPATDYARQTGDAPFDAPDLAELAAQIAQAPVPVIAVLDGVISGGALALALAARHRIALAGACFSASETALGLVLAGGGLVRLARRAGAEAALTWGFAGRSLSAPEAEVLGLCDRVVAEPDLHAAIRALAATPEDAPAISLPEAYLAGLERARAQPVPALLAPLRARAAEVAEAALLLPEEEAVRFGEVVQEDLLRGELSLALRHQALALRRATWLAGQDETIDPARVPPRVALWNQPPALAAQLLGQGTRVQMGASGGAGQSAVEQALTIWRRAQAETASAAAPGGIAEAEPEEAAQSRITAFETPAAIAPCDIVIASPRPGEAAQLRLGKPACAILALEGTPALHGEIGLLRRTGLAEVHAAGQRVSVPLTALQPDALSDSRQSGARDLALAAQVGSMRGEAGVPAPRLAQLAAVLRGAPAVVLHARGLLGRLEAAFYLAAERLVMAGAAPAAVDRALVDWGFAQGPFARLDRRGLARAFELIGSAGLRAGPYLTWLGLEGRLGRAAGQGVWLYPPGAAAAEPWQDEAQELAALRAEAGARPCALAGEEITARMLAELAQAGAQALQDGAVHRAGDVDLAAVAATGFPRHRGGPLFQADLAGLVAIRKRLRALSAEEGAPAPAPLWDVLLRNGRRFADLG